MEEITKHINDTNASYRDLGTGDAKNTDLFLDNEHYNFFQDCGDQITVRFEKTNLTQAILFVASILPRKFDQSSIHTTVEYSDEFVLDQLAILDALFKDNGHPVNKITQNWNIRKNRLKKNGKIDNRFYFNNLLKEVEYKAHNGSIKKTKFTIRNYFAGGFSNLIIKKAPNGIFDVEIKNVTEPYDDGKEEGIEDVITPLTELHNNHSWQQIYYGAPGTGKSHNIKCETEASEKKGRVVRTTFHPDSDYSTFVGAYKPTTESVQRYDIYNKPITRDGETVMEQVITYEFVEQAFLQAYIDAWKNREEAEFLIIEEINRGNCAQIFGDLFQLLDRGDDGYSEYAIRADKDLQNHLSKAFKDVEIEDYPNVKMGKELLLPNNLYIRATMNTSDQSLFPIDSAFKRRWDWKYVPIAKGGAELNWVIDIDGNKYDWWAFVKTINKHVLDTTDSEDKQLGFFFCKAKDNIINAETFVSKVIFYLWNDVFKDFGFDGSIFADKEDEKNPKLSFDKFYIANGEVNIKTVNKFLANLEMKPIEEDEESEEDEDGNNKKSDYKGRDYTKYSINGSGQHAKNNLAAECVKKYIELFPLKTAEEVLEDWRRLGNIVSHFIESKKEYDARTDNNKRSHKIPCGDTVIYVAHNGYGGKEKENGNKKIDTLIKKVHNMNCGITIEKA